MINIAKKKQTLTDANAKGRVTTVTASGCLDLCNQAADCLAITFYPARCDTLSYS